MSLLAPAASRRYTRSQKHALPRTARTAMVWFRGVHLMLDAPTAQSFRIRLARNERLAAALGIDTRRDLTVARWDLK